MPDKFGKTPVNDAESNGQTDILQILEDVVGENTTSDETSLEELDTASCTCGASNQSDQVINLFNLHLNYSVFVHFL